MCCRNQERSKKPLLNLILQSCWRIFIYLAIQNLLVSPRKQNLEVYLILPPCPLGCLKKMSSIMQQNSTRKALLEDWTITVVSTCMFLNLYHGIRELDIILTSKVFLYRIIFQVLHMKPVTFFWKIYLVCWWLLQKTLTLHLWLPFIEGAIWCTCPFDSTGLSVLGGIIFINFNVETVYFICANLEFGFRILSILE